MGSITMDIQKTQYNSCRDITSDRESDIHEFTLKLQMLEDSKKNNKDSTSLNSSEYCNLQEDCKKKYKYYEDNDVENSNQSIASMETIHSKIETNSDCNNRQNCTEVKTIQSISDLTKHFEQLLISTDNKINNNKWQFNYIDSKLGCLDMVVKKVNSSNISIIISSLNVNENNMKIMTQQLQNRLLSKGWVSQISQATNNELSMSVYGSIR